MEQERTANALLLFYEKVQPRDFPSDSHEKHEQKNATDQPQTAKDNADAIATAGEQGVNGDARLEKTTRPSSPSSSAVSDMTTTTTSAAPPPEGTAPVSTTATSSHSSTSKQRISESSSTSHPDNMSTSESDLENAAEEKSSADAGREKREPGGVALLDGVEAFSEEVWQANVQFMLNSYVFDTEFHHFLRQVRARGLEIHGFCPQPEGEVKVMVGVGVLSLL